MDNKSDKFDEEEYRPSNGEESTNAFDASTTSDKSSGLLDGKMPNIAEHLNRKNIIIAVGVLIGLFCVYKIADVLFAPGIPRHKPTTSSALTANNRQAPVVTAAPAPVVQQTAAPVSSGVLDHRLTTLEQQSNMEQSNLDKLTTQVSDMQSALANLDSKLSALNDSMQTVATQVAKQQAAAEAKQAAKKRAYVAPIPIYYVRAMVPGRAWLATQDGGTITVSLGNNLPGYGTIEVIDPNQGTLITSTGAIIGYSPSDS